MTTSVASVRFEHHREPIGVGERAPRLSWAVTTDVPGWRQSAYEIELLSGGATSATGSVRSEESVLVPWPGPPLRSRERVAVRVRVWGPDASGPSAWSPSATVEAGLLEASDWVADLVRPPLPDDRDEPVMLLRREFDVDRPVLRARLHATAQGVYEAELNGAVVGDQVLSPGWTSYRHRLRYQTYDVTTLVAEGPNAIGVQLADGWFRGYVGFTGTRGHYGDRTGLLLQLEIDHPDGSRTIVTSDDAWRSTPAATTGAGLYRGETFDARLEDRGWSRVGGGGVGGRGAGWEAVEVGEIDRTILVAPTGPPVRRTQLVPAVEITRSPSGRVLVDFGQNLVGRLRLTVPAAAAGTAVTLRHAEVLEHGELGTRPLRGAWATDILILDGGGPRTWEPRFTFHGFRYAEVDGWPGDLRLEDITAVVLHTDLRRTGRFTSSSDELNRLHENIVWGMRGNFLDLPTDCPQRDERLGWTGDLQVFAPSAAFLYDTAGMLRSWLADLAVEQLEDHDGIVPIFVPFLSLLPFPVQAEVGWGDAAVIVPWVQHQRFGDIGMLADQWASMTAWIDAFARRAGPDLDFPEGGFSFGDWLDTAAPPDDPAAAATPWQFVATAYLTRSARIVAAAAALLGHDGTRFTALAAAAARRFRQEYVTPTGRIAFPSQTAYALALEFDLLEPTQRIRAGDLLAEQVAADGWHIASGFLGTPVIPDALVESGHIASAYALLLQREHPSWLYPVTMGATTVWERWDSMLPDGTINPGEMTSFNHYAFGAVADWLHRTVAGLAPGAPGYRRLLVRPRPGPGITAASAEHETPYGPASVAWTLADGVDLEVRVVVPPGCDALVELPDGSVGRVLESGGHVLHCSIDAPAPVVAPRGPWHPDA